MLDEATIINEVLPGCIKGDRKSQEMLYRNFYKVMMNIAMRYTKNETDALDVLNTGFFKVYKHIKQFNPRHASLYTWIRKVVINSCLDYAKKQKTYNAIQSFEGELPDVSIPADGLTKLSANDILAFVRQLPSATQTVFNLYVIEGYNHIEIATLLDISEGTSKWHLSNARKQLQLVINKQALRHE